LCDSDVDWVGIEHGVVEGEVAGELDEVAGVCDVEVVEFGYQWGQEFAQLGNGDVGAGEGGDGECLVGEVPAMLVLVVVTVKLCMN